MKNDEQSERNDLLTEPLDVAETTTKPLSKIRVANSRLVNANMSMPDCLTTQITMTKSIDEHQFFYGDPCTNYRSRLALSPWMLLERTPREHSSLVPI